MHLFPQTHCLYNFSPKNYHKKFSSIFNANFPKYRLSKNPERVKIIQQI